MQTPFTLSPDAPGIIMKIILQEGVGVDLEIVEAHDTILSALRQNGLTAPLGKPLSDVLHGYGELDEWIEHVMRIKYMPYVKALHSEAANQVTSQMLQYITFLNGWFLTELTVHKDSDYLMAMFSPLDMAREDSSMRQLMVLKQYQMINDQTPESGHWTIDCLREQIFLSHKVARMVGLGNRAVIISMEAYIKLIHPQDREKLTGALDKIAEPVITFSHRCITPDSATVYLHSYASPVYDENGRLARIYGLTENITEQTHDQSNHILAKDRFDNLVSQSQKMIAIYNGQTEYLYISPDFARLAGTTPESVRGKKLGELNLKSKEGDAVIERTRQLIAGGTASNIEYVSVDSGEDRRWYQYQLFPVLGREGDQTEMIAIAQDITEDKKREALLKYLSQHDMLTKMLNRRQFWQTMGNLDRQKAEGYCLVLVDIDGLRLINNVYGQPKGDQVLLDVSNVIKTIFEGEQNIFHIGGDDFAIILFHTDMEKTSARCERITEYSRSTIKRLLPISISWGVACINEAEDGQALFRLCETRLYDNKLLHERSTQSQVVSALRESLSFRNVETADHMTRMEYMVGKLGKRLGLSTHDYDRMLLLAAMHDVGKLGIPDAILNKPGPLANEEWAIMRTHSDIGYRIAMSCHSLSGIAADILSHHERWDGTGYPSGLRGEQIPMLAQVIAVVDAYDVITHARPYKPAQAHEEAIAELRRCKGTQFSPTVTQLFLDIFKNLTPEDIRRFN